MIFDKLVLFKVFTKSHLSSGYHQIAMKDRSTYTINVHHSYEVMGVFRHAVRAVKCPSILQRLMNNAFVAEIDCFIFVFLWMTFWY